MSSGPTKAQYIVIAYRYGDVTDYHYPVGVFSSEVLAIKAAKDHRAFRGGKYDHVIYKVDQDADYDAEEAEIVYNKTAGLI